MANVLIFLLILTQSASAQDAVKGYTAKPGDLVTVTVWERQSLSGTVVVDTNGNITLPMPVGSILVSGLTAKEISDLLTERLKEYLVTPTVFVSITPAEGFFVHVLGEVTAPRSIKVPDGTTVQEAITEAEGFTAFADKKHIRLIRKKEKDDETTEMTLDFQQFIDKSDLSFNPALKSGDVLIVPRLPKSERIKYFNVIGSVTKPGTFNIEEPLPLTEALALAGGPLSTAILDNISIFSVSDNKYTWKHINFANFLSGKDAAANPIISMGDTVFVPGEPKEKRPFMVNVVGQVIRPGAYSVIEESRLLDAISQAGGFAEEAAIEIIDIIRPGSQISSEHVNIKEYLISGDEKQNPLLMKGDTIFVPMLGGAKRIPAIHAAFIPTIRISIIGSVTKPDIYQVSADANILDIMNIAGGYTYQADLKRITIIREANKPGEKNQRQIINLKKVLTEGQLQLLPKLNSGDTILVPRMPEENLWRTIVRLAADLSTLAIFFLIITGNR